MVDAFGPFEPLGMFASPDEPLPPDASDCPPGLPAAVTPELAFPFVVSLPT
jgi:hypothetical protein